MMYTVFYRQGYSTLTPLQSATQCVPPQWPMTKAIQLFERDYPGAVVYQMVPNQSKVDEVGASIDVAMAPLPEAVKAILSLYNSTPGAAPCCPEALASVFELAGAPVSDVTSATLTMLASELRKSASTC